MAHVYITRHALYPASLYIATPHQKLLVQGVNAVAIRKRRALRGVARLHVTVKSLNVLSAILTATIPKPLSAETDTSVSAPPGGAATPHL